MASVEPTPAPSPPKKPPPKMKAPPATSGAGATTAEAGVAAEAKPAEAKSPPSASKKGPPMKKGPGAAGSTTSADETDTKKGEMSTAAEGKPPLSAAKKGPPVKKAAGLTGGSTPPKEGVSAEKAAAPKDKAEAVKKGPAIAKTKAEAAKPTAPDGGNATDEKRKTDAGAKEEIEKAAEGKNGKTAEAAAAKGEKEGPPKKEKEGLAPPGKKGATAAPRRSLQDLLSKEASKAAAGGDAAADDPVAVASKQLLQYYDKSQEMLIQQQQYYVNADKQQLLQKQEQALKQEPPAEEVSRLRKSAAIVAEDAVVLAAVKNVHKKEFGRRRLREYMLEQHKDKRAELLQGKVSENAVGAEMAKKNPKLLNAKEWSALVEAFKAEAAAWQTALDTLKTEGAKEYEALMASDYRDAIKLQQQEQVKQLLEKLLALPGATFLSANLLEILIDEIEFAHALIDVRAYLEKQQDVLRALVDSEKFLSSPHTTRTTTGATDTSATRPGATTAGTRRSVGAVSAATRTKATTAESAGAASGKGTMPGRRRVTTPGRTADAATGRGASVWGGAVGGNRAAALAGKRAVGGGVAAAGRGPSAETLRLMGQKLFATALESLQKEFALQYRTATLIGAARSLEGLEVKREPCWLALMLLPVEDRTGIFMHHNIISYMLLFFCSVSYVRLQQCSSLTYRAVEADMNKRISKLPMQIVSHRTDIAYFYHVVRFFFRDGVRLLPLDRLRYRATQQALAAANQLLPVCASNMKAHIYVSLDALSHEMISSPDAEQPLPHFWRKAQAPMGKSASQEISLMQFIEEYKLRAQVRKDVLVWQQPVDGVDVPTACILLQHLLKTLTAAVERHNGQCIFRRTEYMMNNDLQIFHRIWLQCSIYWGGTAEDPRSAKRLNFTVADNFRWEG